MKIKDVTRQKSYAISLINKNNDFKSVRVYSYKSNLIIKSITHDDLLQISASTPTGPSSYDDIISIFSDLTSKSIENFKTHSTSQAIYFAEVNTVFN